MLETVLATLIKNCCILVTFFYFIYLFIFLFFFFNLYYILGNTMYSYGNYTEINCCFWIKKSEVHSHERNKFSLELHVYTSDFAKPGVPLFALQHWRGLQAKLQWACAYARSHLSFFLLSTALEISSCAP